MRAGLGLRSMRFVLVSAAGIIVQIGSLMLLCDVMGLSAMPATVAAVEIAVLHNFFWHLRWTWAAERAGFRRTSTLRLLWRFHVANGAISIATGVGFTRLFMEAVGMHYAVANLLSIGVGGLANFAAAEFLVFRKEDSTMRLRLISRMFLATLVGLILSARPANHGIDTRMEQFLRRNAGFGDRELAEARSGARVVRTLDPGIPQEMVTAGVTRFEVPFDYYFERARTGDLYRTGPTLVELGRFSANPTAADLEGLTLDRGDLEPLRELDPAAAESAPAAKEALARLVREYRNQGILWKYTARAPEYITNYPPAGAALVAEYFAWAKVNIGLKKLVRLTKVTVWERFGGPRREAVMVTEQVYASRYFQASLQVDHIIAEDDGAVCLVTINRGRCDVLASAIARLLRPVILSRTRASTQRALDLAKLVIESEYRSVHSKPVTAAVHGLNIGDRHHRPRASLGTVVSVTDLGLNRDLHSVRNGEAGRRSELYRLQSGLSAQP